MPEKMIEVYDTHTNKKLPQRVPEGWLRIFKHLSTTPKQKATSGQKQTTKKES